MLYAVVRSGFVLTGLLLLAVGIGNVVAGRSKVAQYEELIVATAPRTPAAPSPATLFPATSEGDERHALARAKVAFYELLVTAGGLLTAIGGALIGIGVLRVWVRAPRAPAKSALAN
ncbi:MAG TPA: hypothetical protein VKA21_05400 [Candidatus Binatia bacterium]|nr:hypothetical protein [Candidatus Binatia bacterium]